MECHSNKTRLGWVTIAKKADVIINCSTDFKIVKLFKIGKKLNCLICIISWQQKLETLNPLLMCNSKI